MGEAIRQEPSENPIITTPNIYNNSETKNEEIPQIVSILIINEDNEVLFGIKHDYLDGNVVSQVGVGHVEESDFDIYKAAVRELLEETGIQPSTHLFCMGQSLIQGKYEPIIYHDFVLRLHGDIVLPVNHHEFHRYFWAKPKDIKDKNLSLSAERAMKVFQRWEM